MLVLYFTPQRRTAGERMGRDWEGGTRVFEIAMKWKRPSPKPKGLTSGCQTVNGY
jgi:hypothetical protein